jgi:lipoprotein NlpD
VSDKGPAAGCPAAGLLLVALGAAVFAAGCETTKPRPEPLPPPPIGAERVEDPTRLDERPAEEEGEPPPAGTFHKVEKGETLWAIAKAYNLPVEDLVEVNGLEQPDVLSVGQLIFIPDDDGLGLPHEPQPVERRADPSTGEHRGTLAWPLEGGVILEDFSATEPVPQDGMLIAAPRGTPVFAAADGEVAFVGADEATLGRMVVVRHDDGLLTIYAHLQRTAVKQGQKIVRGTRIGDVGSSGRTPTPQLHFQVRRGRTPENPLDHLPAP